MSSVYQQHYATTKPIGLTDDQVQAAGRVIDAIRAAHGGVCPPGRYVEAARPEDSPIHDTLDWDPEAALERQLLAQARKIVRLVVTVAAPTPGVVVVTPVFVNASVTTTDAAGEEVRGTASPEAVVASVDWCSQAERQLLNRIRGDCVSHGYLRVAKLLLAFLDGLDQQQGQGAGAPSPTPPTPPQRPVLPAPPQPQAPLGLG